MPCDDFVIDGYDDQTNEIIPIYAVEYPHKRIYTEKYFADHGMAGKIVHTRMPILLNSVEDMDNSGINFELYGSALQLTRPNPFWRCLCSCMKEWWG